MTENKFSNLNETADTTAQFDKQDIEQNKVLSLFAYLGILILIPVLAVKDSGFTRFHINQGLVLLIVSFCWGIIYRVLIAIFAAIFSLGMLKILSIILNLASLAFVVLAIIGIINALGGKAKELPLIGKFRIVK